jgi:hypothetical protein
MEIVTSWMEQGIEKGLQRGRQEGEQTIVLRQLNRCLSAVSMRLQSRIRKLPVEKLEALAEALFDFKETDDLRRWLDENEAKPAAAKKNSTAKSKKRR